MEPIRGKTMKRAFLIATVALALAACGRTSVEQPAKPSGIAISNFDTSVAPGDDFFTYANGEWLKTATMPPGYPFNGSLIEINLRVERQIGDIIEEIVAGGDFAANSPEGQIKSLYQSYLDTDSRNALGVSPLKPELDAIFAATSHSDLARLMGSPTHHSIFGGYVWLDARNPNRYLSILQQGDLGIGNIESYLKDGDPYPAIREAYVAYARKIFELAGIDNAVARAAAVLNLETALANVFWTRTEMRDPVRMYHLMTPAELLAYAPGFDWSAMWAEKDRADQEAVIVQTDTAVRASARIFGETSLEDLKSYMVFRTISSSAEYLSSDFDQAHFEFFSKTLRGVAEQRHLGDRAIALANMFVQEQLGNVYADKYYTSETEEQAELLVGYMKQAVLNRLTNNEWMDEATRQEAIEKFNYITWKVGRPERGHDLSTMSFAGEDLLGNLRQIATWRANDDAARLKEPRRKWEWLLPPQVVNAYYQAEMNDVVLPIGILQPPVFDPMADAAANFGGILAIIGHEVGHGFDDKGSQSDANGVLRNWWSDASRAEFESRTSALVAQYDQYSPIEGVHLNGRLTLGENIGDLGGLTIAYNAYRDYVRKHQGGEAPVIDGLTGDQRFFLAFAQLWRFVYTDNITRQLALTDNHSPGKFRVNGVVRNLGPWYEAFEVTPENELNLPPEERVSIW